MATKRRSRRKATLEERYDATAARWNKKQAEKNPLFAEAGILDQVVELRDAQFYLDSEERRHARMEAHHERILRLAAYYRVRIGRRDPELVRDLDAKWEARTWTKAPEYEADFWHSAWRKLREGREREEILGTKLKTIAPSLAVR